MTTAAGALRLIQVNYEAGYLQAMAQRLQDTVGLFVALGGGWWNDPGIVRAP